MYDINDEKHARLMASVERAQARWDDAINANGIGSPLNLPARKSFGRALERLDAYRNKIDGVTT